ncbi:MAG: choice-of-anchor tandem repeat GloVer-containing protein, partial [Bacteroidota bacterium]
MKKIIILALCLGILNTTFSQGEYWGVTRGGGVGGAGSVYKIDEDATNPTIVHSFAYEVPGADPEEAKLVELNGLLYGTTESGGFDGQGTLYSYDPSTGTATSLVFFEESVNGAQPISAVLTRNGKIYGLTAGGGPNDGAGTIFEYDPVADTIVVITVFDGDEFTGEECQITFGADGTLYVVSEEGGFEGDGVFFEVDIPTGQLLILHEFDDSAPEEGRRPNGELVELSPGVFYGTAQRGGANGDGVLYKFDTNTGTYTKLIDFSNSTTGEFSYSGLILASNQKMYGTTERGGGGQGTIFEFDPVSETISVLHVFTGADGENSLSGLLETNPGILYGMTESGGANDDGTLFEYDLNTSTFTKKVDFEQGTVGFRPNGEFFQASDGKLYATLSSGAISSGTVFAYTPGDTNIQIVIEFETTLSGAEPTDQLCLAQNGKVYGFTTDGGAEDRGVLFEIDPGTGQYTVLYDFVDLADGRTLEGPLVTIGNTIYGVASNGGSALSFGTLFSYDLDTGIFTVEHEFEDATGRNPGAGLIVTSQGTLVGTALNGSAVTGNIFEFDPTTGTYAVLFEFDITVTGSFVKAPLLEYEPGVFYGTLTNFNFNTDGGVFKYDRNTDTYTFIHEFTGGTLDGEDPETPLLLAQDGLIYGTTNGGGIDDDGVLFSIDPATDTYSVVLDFLEDPEPNQPSGGALIQAPNGKIYGSTPDAGPGSDGILYEIDLDQGTVTGIILDFLLYNKVQGGFISIPDVYIPEAVCQDLTVDLTGNT